jgi:hypothetical protein
MLEKHGWRQGFVTIGNIDSLVRDLQEYTAKAEEAQQQSQHEPGSLEPAAAPTNGAAAPANGAAFRRQPVLGKGNSTHACVWVLCFVCVGRGVGFSSLCHCAAAIRCCQPCMRNTRSETVVLQVASVLLCAWRSCT